MWAARELRIQPGVLFALLQQSGAEQLRIEADDAPAAQLEGEPVGTERRQPPLQAGCVDDLPGLLARRLDADIVVAGNRIDRRFEAAQRLGGKGNFGVAIGGL